MTKYLATYDDVTHSLEALDPARATGVGLPAMQIVNALPTAGTVAGEVYLVSPTRTAYVWSGTNFLPIVPSAILTYANDAAVYADTAPAAGSYGASQETGNLFIRTTVGWRQVGTRIYATNAAMLADTTAHEGDIAFDIDTQQHYTRTGANWVRLAGPNISIGVATPASGTAGDLFYNSTTKHLSVRTATAWNELAGGATVAAAAPATHSNGDLWLDTTTNAMKVWDGAAWVSPTDAHVKRGDITLGANAATEQEIILIKGIPANNGSIYIDLSDKLVGQPRAAYSIHAVAAEATGVAPMVPIHFYVDTSHFLYFRWYWKDTTDSYCLAAKVTAGNTGVVYSASVRFPNALDSSVSFDGNTVSTNMGGTKVDATKTYPSTGLLVSPKFERIVRSDGAGTSTHGLWLYGIDDDAVTEIFVEIISADCDMRVGLAFADSAGTQMAVGHAAEAVTGTCVSNWANEGNGSVSMESILPNAYDETWGTTTLHFMKVMPHAKNTSDLVKRNFPGTVHIVIDNSGTKSRIWVETFAQRVSGDLNIGNKFDLFTTGNKVGKITLLNSNNVAGATVKMKGWRKVTPMGA